METLNLEQNRLTLLEKALQKGNNDKEAAKLLGIHPRTLATMKKRFGIRWDSLRGRYVRIKM